MNMEFYFQISFRWLNCWIEYPPLTSEFHIMGLYFKGSKKLLQERNLEKFGESTVAYIDLIIKLLGGMLVKWKKNQKEHREIKTQG